MDVQGGFKKNSDRGTLIVCLLHNGSQLVFCTNINYIVSASLIAKNDLVNLVLTSNTNGVES